MTLDQTMRRLDIEETEAARPRQVNGVPPDAAVRYLRDLAGTWRATDGGLGRKMLAAALFERLEATGFQELKVRLTDTAIAYGFAAAIPQRLELGIVDYGRGERSRADTFQLIVRIDRGNVQGGLRRAAEIA